MNKTVNLSLAGSRRHASDCHAWRTVQCGALAYLCDAWIAVQCRRETQGTVTPCGRHKTHALQGHKPAVVPGGLCGAHLHHMRWWLYVADTWPMPHITTTACGGGVFRTALQELHHRTAQTEHRRGTENSSPAGAAAARHLHPLQYRAVQK